jgi:hypothetical protein
MPLPTDAMRIRGKASPAADAIIRRKLGDILFDSAFQYGINFAYTTGVEALTGTIPIQSDAHFMCVETLYDMHLTTVPAFASTGIGVVPALAAGGYLVLLTDGGTQRALSNIAVPASTLFGSAQRPFVWPFTHLFKANTSIGIVSTGIGTPVALTTVRYVFAGFKIPLGSVPELGL